MRALVTGATGFVGSHLAELLISQGVDVVAPVRNASRLRWAAGLDARIVQTSFSDREGLRSLVADRDTIPRCRPDQEPRAWPVLSRKLDAHGGIG